MKKILIVVGFVVVLAVVGGLLLFSNLDSIVKSAVETFGSRATGTKVTLDRVGISLTSGEGTLRGLKVANPEGFTSGHAIEMGEITVKLDTSTVTSDTVVVREVLIDAPRVAYEVGLGGSNLGKIQSNLAAFGGSSSDAGGKSGAGSRAGGADKSDAGTKESGGKKFIVKDLKISHGRVTAGVSIAGAGRNAAASIPEIHLTDIGSGSGGVSPAELAAKVLDALVDAALKSAGGLSPELGKRAEDALKGVLGK